MPGYMTCCGVGAIEDTGDELKEKLYHYADKLGVRNYVDKLVGQDSPEDTPSGMPLAQPAPTPPPASGLAALPTWAKYALLLGGTWILWRYFEREIMGHR